jgi:hypothetical protein
VLLAGTVLNPVPVIVSDDPGVPLVELNEVMAGCAKRGLIAHRARKNTRYFFMFIIFLYTKT